MRSWLVVSLVLAAAAAPRRLSAQADGPHIIHTSVPPGTRDLPSGELELTFTFDAPVTTDSIWEREGALLFPTILHHGWSEDRRTLILQVRVAPGREYGIRFRPGRSSYRFRTAPME